MSAQEYVVRKKMVKNVLLETVSWESGSSLQKWHNCLYLVFKKSDFPNFKYPDLTHDDYSKKRRFDYYKSSFIHVSFHWGITFYEEKIHQELGETFVKIGADYQHLNDELTYGLRDCGAEILEDDGLVALNSFLEVHENNAPGAKNESTN